MAKKQTNENETEAEVLEKTEVKEPSLYKVLMHDDDFTPMDFVVLMLCKYFNKEEEDAIKIMLTIHETGIGECGIYSFEVAEAKIDMVTKEANSQNYPLKCSTEEV